MRCAIYNRISGDGSEDDGTSLATQEARNRAHAAEQSWEVVACESEIKSGFLLYERKKLMALWELARQREVDVILCYALDRLSREQNYTAVLFSEFERLGAELRFVTRNYGKTAVGKFMRSADSFVAESEREKIIERTVRGRGARVKLRGRPLASSRPRYGYLWASDDKDRLVKNPETAPVVRRIFDEAENGLSTARIARGLTADKIPTATGGDRWIAVSVLQMLKEPTYYGDVHCFRYAGQTKSEVRISDEVTVLAGIAEPIVDRAKWERVQRALVQRRTFTYGRNAHPEASLLRNGHVVCGYCGCAMAARNETYRGKIRARYSCSRENTLKHEHPSNCVDASVIDAEVWKYVKELLTDPDRVMRCVQAEASRQDYTDEIVAFQRRAAEIEKQRTATAKAISMIEDDEAIAPLVAQLQSLAVQRRRCDEEVEKLESWQRREALKRRDPEGFKRWCATVAANLDAMDYWQRRGVVETLRLQAVVRRKGDGQRFQVEHDLEFLDSARNGRMHECGPRRLRRPLPYLRTGAEQVRVISPHAGTAAAAPTHPIGLA